MIFKVTSWTRGRKAAKASIRYIMHRPDRDGKRASRSLFGDDGPTDKYLAYMGIDTAPRGSSFCRATLSPDPETKDIFKDLDLWSLTQVSMLYMKEKLGKDIQFFASSHEEQTDVRHVSMLVVVPRRLTREEFFQFPKLILQAAEIDARWQ